MQKIPITAIRTDGGTQPRAQIDLFTVDDYADAMRAGAIFPPVDVFHDGETYWLADGFHRHRAAVQAGLSHMDATIHRGTRRDALLFSVGANAAHGLRRTNADKRRAVATLLGDDEWISWSDHEIARRCAVNHHLVASMRPSLGETPSEMRTYTTKHGTTATMNVANIGRPSAPGVATQGLLGPVDEPADPVPADSLDQWQPEGSPAPDTADADAYTPVYYKRGADTPRTTNEEERQPFDHCQTPGYAIDPLLYYLPPGIVWEPARGEGLLVEAFYDAGRDVVSSDIGTGENFFNYEPDGWDVLVTNPPYSLKYRWLERCYKLGKPFALLLPVETLGARTAQELFIEHGVQVIFLDRRINFKMPKKGWEGSAPFPVAWFTWGLNLPSQMVFAVVTPDVQTEPAVELGQAGGAVP